MELVRNGLWIFSIVYAAYGVLQMIANWILIKQTKKSFEYQLISKNQEQKIENVKIKAQKKAFKKVLIGVCIIIVLIIS